MRARPSVRSDLRSAQARCCVRLASRFRAPILNRTERLTHRTWASCTALALPAFLRVIGFVVEPLLSDAEIHRGLGEPARIRRQVPDPAHLSVVTWNIERGKEYDAIVRELKALDADVVLLQEVDRGCRRIRAIGTWPVISRTHST